MPFRGIDDPVKLRRVLEAALLIEADLDLPTLLRHIVEEARSMTNARYGALGVLNDDGSGLAEFITAGLEREEEELIGASAHWSRHPRPPDLPARALAHC